MRVLILRPKPGASATAALVSRAGHEPVVVPLFEMVPVDWSLPRGRFDAVAMTSANAARLGGDGLRAVRRLPLYAVGEATAEAARAAGFSNVQAGAGDADDLAALVPPGRILRLCGTERRALPLPHVTELPVYTAVPTRVDAAALQGDVALVHAASAGHRLADLVPLSERARLAIVAISERAVAACGTGWRSIAVATSPRDDAMLALLPALL